jgi:hypothetical protein
LPWEEGRTKEKASSPTFPGEKGVEMSAHAFPAAKSKAISMKIAFIGIFSPFFQIHEKSIPTFSKLKRTSHPFCYFGIAEGTAPAVSLYNIS